MTKKQADSGRRRSFVRIPADTALELIATVSNAGCAIQRHGEALISRNSHNGRWVGEEDAAIDAAVLHTAMTGLDRVEDVLSAAISAGDADEAARASRPAAVHIDDMPAPVDFEGLLNALGFNVVAESYERVINADGREVRITGDKSLIDQVGDAYSATLNPAKVKPERKTSWDYIAAEEGFQSGWTGTFDRVFGAAVRDRETVLAGVKPSDFIVGDKNDSEAYIDGVSIGVASAKHWFVTRGLRFIKRQEQA